MRIDAFCRGLNTGWQNGKLSGPAYLVGDVLDLIILARDNLSYRALASVPAHQVAEGADAQHNCVRRQVWYIIAQSVAGDVVVHRKGSACGRLSCGISLTWVSGQRIQGEWRLGHVQRLAFSFGEGRVVAGDVVRLVDGQVDSTASVAIYSRAGRARHWRRCSDEW